MGAKITCIAKNNTFSCINQWYHGNNSCPLSCDESIVTHLPGEYLCTVKCNIRSKEYVTNVTKVVVIVEASTLLPLSTSGEFLVASFSITFKYSVWRFFLVLWCHRQVCTPMALFTMMSSFLLQFAEILCHHPVQQHHSQSSSSLFPFYSSPRLRIIYGIDLFSSSICTLFHTADSFHPTQYPHLESL